MLRRASSCLLGAQRRCAKVIGVGSPEGNGIFSSAPGRGGMILDRSSCRHQQSGSSMAFSTIAKRKRRREIFLDVAPAGLPSCGQRQSGVVLADTAGKVRLAIGLRPCGSFRSATVSGKDGSDRWIDASCGRGDGTGRSGSGAHGTCPHAVTGAWPPLRSFDLRIVPHVSMKVPLTSTILDAPINCALLAMRRCGIAAAGGRSDPLGTTAGPLRSFGTGSNGGYRENSSSDETKPKRTEGDTQIKGDFAASVKRIAPPIEPSPLQPSPGASKSSSEIGGTSSSQQGVAPKDGTLLSAIKVNESGSGDSVGKGTIEGKDIGEGGAAVAGDFRGNGGHISSIGGTIRQNLPKMGSWRLSDLMAVYSTILLLAAVIFTPTVVDQMRKSDSIYGALDTDDPVAHIEKIVRSALKAKYESSEEYDNGEADADHRRSGIEDMMSQILGSEALQRSVTSLVTRVIQSDQFQDAARTLLKNLWNDLINDPETTAQVVQLLNNAIQHEDVRRAVNDLVMQLIADEEVYDEFTKLLVRLGNEEEVVSATQALLTESTHKALNDPEILDHSMEFATDVVGDDVVQRTSGEALRNTVTYAVRPGLSVFLSVAGLGLLVFSLSALGTARSPDIEGTSMDSAASSIARGIQTSVSKGLYIWSIPSRAFSFTASVLVKVIFFPVQLVQRAASGLGQAGGAAYTSAVNAFSAVAMFPSTLWNKMFSYASQRGEALSLSLGKAGSAVSASFVGVGARGIVEFGTKLLSAMLSAASSFGRLLHASGDAARQWGGSASRAWGSAMTWLVITRSSIVAGFRRRGADVSCALNLLSSFPTTAWSYFGNAATSWGRYLNNSIANANELLATTNQYLTSAGVRVEEYVAEIAVRVGTAIRVLFAQCCRIFRGDRQGGGTDNS